MPKKTRRNKKNKRRRKRRKMEEDNEEEKIVLNHNPEPQDIDKFIDKLIVHNQASLELRTFLVYVMERQTYGPELSDEFALFCLSSYFILRNNYEDVSKRYVLPSSIFLKEEMFRKFSFMPGIRDIILDLFKVKTEFCEPDSKICVLLIDEHALRPQVTVHEKYGTLGFEDDGNEVAYFATTIWISAVNEKMSIPFAYYFNHESCSADLLKNYLFEAITKLDRIDIEVIGVVAKLKKNVLKLCNMLNISRENQIFKVGNKDIVFLYDVHHLVNITRNNFLTYKFQYKDMCTSPKDVGKLFFTEWQFSSNTTITKSHLVPDREQSNHVRYAFELLSTEVATAMTSYISAGLMPKSATGTAQCIEMFDTLFKLMNSNRINFGNQLHSGYIGSKLQVDFLKKFIKFFEKLKVFDIHNNDRTDQLIFKKAWVISIKGMMQLWEVMKQKNYPHLLTYHINCEFIDLFIRSTNLGEPSYGDPTAWKFMAFYELFFINHYFSYWPQEYFNSEEFDIDRNYAQIVFKRIPPVSHDLTGKTKVEKIFYPEIKNTAEYFVEFLERWADYLDYLEQLYDDNEMV